MQGCPVVSLVLVMNGELVMVFGKGCRLSTVMLCFHDRMGLVSSAVVMYLVA